MARLAFRLELVNISTDKAHYLRIYDCDGDNIHSQKRLYKVFELQKFLIFFKKWKPTHHGYFYNDHEISTRMDEIMQELIGSPVTFRKE